MPTSSTATAVAAEPGEVPDLSTTATDIARAAKPATTLDLPNTTIGVASPVQAAVARDLPTLSTATAAVATVGTEPTHAPHISSEDLLPHGPTLQAVVTETAAYLDEYRDSQEQDQEGRSSNYKDLTCKSESDNEQEGDDEQEGGGLEDLL
jgi:hypothetical protein